MDEQNLDKTTQTTSRILLKSIAARDLLVVGDGALTSGTIHVQAYELVGSEKYIDTITITTQRYTFILQTNESSSVSETSSNDSSNTIRTNYSGKFKSIGNLILLVQVQQPVQVRA